MSLTLLGAGPSGGTALSPTYVDGGWSWFTNPRAVYYNGAIYTSTINGDGDLLVHELIANTGALESAPIYGRFSVDDHSHGAVLVRDSDKRIMVFATRHNDTTVNMYVARNVEDASGFVGGVSLDASLGQTKYDYPSPIQLTDEANNPIYLFYRHLGAGDVWDGQYYSKSVDDGATWAAGTQFFVNGTERPYFQYARNGTARIDFACVQGHPNAVATSVYHFYYQGAKWYTSDGAEIEAPLPLETTDVTLVYDGSTVRAWGWDIAIDGSGNPVIVYATFPTPASDHRYRYAKWTGLAWSDNEICTAGGPLYAGETYYSGGVTIDKSNPNVVWCSRYVDSEWQIWRYVTADGGANWTGAVVALGGADVVARPYCAVDAPAGTQPLWWRGTYTSYTDFDVETLIGNAATVTPDSNGLLGSLIAYWPGNEANGTLIDAHTNALDLTGTPGSNYGKVYTNSRQYVTVSGAYHTRDGDDALLSTGDVDFTIATWVYLDSKAANQALVSKWKTAGGGREYQLAYITSTDRFTMYARNAGDSANVSVAANNLGSPSTDTWYFVVAWHDATADTLNIQVNNGTADSAAMSGGVQDSDAKFIIGAYDGGYQGTDVTNGRIGPTAFWKSAAGNGGALSADYRTALYNAGTGLKYASFTA